MAWRNQHLRRRLRPVPPGESLHLVLDSTGLSIVGEGEWAAAKHGGRGLFEAGLAELTPEGKLRPMAEVEPVPEDQHA